MLSIAPGAAALIGTILLDVRPGAARALAMFNAAATVNRVQSVPGFRGAAFMVNAADDRLFELLWWDSAEAFAAARDDHRYADHVAIVEDHASVRYAGFSNLLGLRQPFSLTRGDPVAAMVVQSPGWTPHDVLELLDRTEIAVGDIAWHVTATPKGAVIASFSKVGRVKQPPLLARLTAWSDDFRVVEAITTDPRLVGSPVTYRLHRRPRRAVQPEPLRGVPAHDVPVRLDLAEPAQVGMIVMRLREGGQRGVLLMNVAETEARIRFLPGYLSASFFTDREGRFVAEYVRWRSPEAVAAAFQQPEFFEHTPVAHAMAEHPTVAFGSLVAVVTQKGAAAFDLEAGDYAMTILRCAQGTLETTRDALALWYGDHVGKTVRAVAIHADAETSQVAVLVAGCGAEPPTPPLDALGATLVENVGPLMLYASVPAGADPACALRYTMLVPY